MDGSGRVHFIASDRGAAGERLASGWQAAGERLQLTPDMSCCGWRVARAGAGARASARERACVCVRARACMCVCVRGREGASEGASERAREI